MHVPTVLRELCGGRSWLDLDLGEGATIAELLDTIATTYPALERRTRDEQGALRAHVNLFVGGEDVRALGGTAAPLGQGDTVSILAAISGG